MSTTIYESPDDSTGELSVEISAEKVWFFGVGGYDNAATLPLAELPALVKAMMEYLEESGWVYCEKCRSWYAPDSLHARSTHPTRRPVT